MDNLWTDTLPAAGLRQAAAAVLRHISNENEVFCLWLRGPLGAGKTTLTGWMLRGLGLPEGQPVTSPTYTYMNEYLIAGAWYAHLDLYRAHDRPHIPSPEELGLADARQFRGVFIEWPPAGAAARRDPYLAPTHILDIAFADAGAARSYRLSKA